MNEQELQINSTGTIRERLQQQELREKLRKSGSTAVDAARRVVRGGENIKVTNLLNPDDALAAVKMWHKAESQIVQVFEELHGIPADAARALMLAVEEEFGMVGHKARQTMFGTQPPPFIRVPVDAAGNTTEVYIGQFTLPGFENATFDSLPDYDNFKLTVRGQLAQKDKPLFEQLMATARRILREESLYRGKSIVLTFPPKEEENDQVLPTFWDVSGEKRLILSEEARAAVGALLWAPIEMPQALATIGVPARRTILIEGPFGTGKTLIAYHTAQKAVRHGRTFVYLKDVKDLAKAVEFASKHYAPAVLFVEDIDRAFDGTSNKENVEIMNVIDGIDSKDRDLIIVFTTNYRDRIPAGMMRHERIDAEIKIGRATPDQALELVKMYAGDKLDEESDMALIGQITAGMSPASIRGVVNTAMQYAIYRNEGDIRFLIDDQDLKLAALNAKAQMEAANREVQRPPSSIELFGTAIGSQISKGVSDAVASIVSGSALHPAQGVATVGVNGKAQ